MTPDEIEQMQKDIEAGTPGPWRIKDCDALGDRATHYFQEVWNDETDILVTSEVTRAHNDGGRANMRRIARVPQLEAEVLRLWVAMHWASELERVAKNLADYDQNAPGASQVRTVINAYRSALKVIDHDT